MINLKNLIRSKQIQNYFSSFVFLFCLTSCFDNSAQIAKKPVVKVNENVLSVKEFSDKLIQELREFDALSAKDPEILRRVKEKIIADFVLRSMMLDFAKQNFLTVSDEELEREINHIRSSYPDDLSFREVLADNNKAFSDWRKDMRGSLIERKVFKKLNEKSLPSSEDELRNYYNNNKDLFKRSESIVLRQIVSDDMTKIESIKSELSKQPFDKLAKKYSVAPEAQSGGLVGEIEKGSVDIFDKAFSLSPGSVSSVLESSYGFHIFKVEKKSPPGYSSFENNKKILRQIVDGKKEQALFAKWLDAQIRASRVMRDRALVDAITVETRMR